MPRKRGTAEQIITKLRQAEVLDREGPRRRRNWQR